MATTAVARKSAADRRSRFIKYQIVTATRIGNPADRIRAAAAAARPPSTGRWRDTSTMAATSASVNRGSDITVDVARKTNAGVITTTSASPIANGDGSDRSR